ncbi:laccase-3-like [Nymphaea colorata]|nr:laccase-3-like [Nymphaea colorata]
MASAATMMLGSGRRCRSFRFSLLLLLQCFFFFFVHHHSEVLAEEVHKYEFVVQETPVKRLCKTTDVITVNGQYPGPLIEVRTGDQLVITAINMCKYDVTLHWHGIIQFRTGWADGPEFVTQCPIKPGGTYTYRFSVPNEEGTLWWHAHSSWLRATVFGGFIIRPKAGKPYPFLLPPQREFPVILGEWWTDNPMDVAKKADRTGAAPSVSDAFTINGQPGDLYPCSNADTTIFPVAPGETNLFRVINGGMNGELFFSIAFHTMTVVAVDAAYTKPFPTNVIMIAPGQTVDVLVTANQLPGRYYMAARAYASAQGIPFDNTTTTAILQYEGIPCCFGPLAPPPAMPLLPAYNDTFTATAFAAQLRSLNTPAFPAKVPLLVDQNLFFTIGLGLIQCPPTIQCGGPNNTRFAASMNNMSFTLPTKMSILEAHVKGIEGVFTKDFPATPPVVFDYTAQNISRDLWQPIRATKVMPIKFGSVVQIVFQDTNIVAAENHPMHIHGYSFYVLAEGFGNFDPATDTAKFNLIDPPYRNTVAVPVNGWAVIRFHADNPGAWLMHCHLDVHITWGLATVLLVEDGVEELDSLEAIPLDYPLCLDL